MKNYLAADIPLGKFEGFGPLGTVTSESGGINTFSRFISSTIGLMTIIGIIWFVFVFFTGAIGIINAGADKNALESSRKKIVTGIVGLVVVIAGIFVIRLLGFILGIPEILNLGELFSRIQQ